MGHKIGSREGCVGVGAGEVCVWEGVKLDSKQEWLHSSAVNHSCLINRAGTIARCIDNIISCQYRYVSVQPSCEIEKK